MYSRLNTNISKGLLAVNFGSNCLSVPAAKFLGFANICKPCSSCFSFILLKLSLDMYTSPLTTISSLLSILRGIFFIVIKFLDISSPITPFPLVAPYLNSPLSYVRPTDKPSILNSTTYSTSSFTISVTLLSKSLKSESEYALDKLNIGILCFIWLNFSSAFPPTLLVGESTLLNSGFSSSSLINSFTKLSYSISDISGLSSL